MKPGFLKSMFLGTLLLVTASVSPLSFSEVCCLAERDHVAEGEPVYQLMSTGIGLFVQRYLERVLGRPFERGRYGLEGEAGVNFSQFTPEHVGVVKACLRRITDAWPMLAFGRLREPCSFFRQSDGQIVTINAFYPWFLRTYPDREEVTACEGDVKAFFSAQGIDPVADNIEVEGDGIVILPPVV